MLKPCVTSTTTRDDPYLRFPAHVVHPESRKRGLFDVRGEAELSHVRHALAPARHRNTFEIVVTSA